MPPVDASSQIPLELHLLPERRTVTARHLAAMAAASVLVHLFLIAFFWNLPEVIPSARGPIISSDIKRAYHLYMPRTWEPTQKAPNVNKVLRSELSVRSEVETPREQTPKARRPQPAPGPVAPPVPAPAPVVEPPKIQVAETPPPPPQTPPTIAPPTPANGTIAQQAPPPASAKPKISFENVSPARPVERHNGPIDPRLLAQRAAIDRMRADEEARASGGGGVTVGDVGDDLNSLPGQTQSHGVMGSALQLLSDPNGFDFKPYMKRVLAAVKRNWIAVIPESAHTGRRGSVLIQFIIDRKGGVPKLVIASSSGTEAFDRAAIAGVSASAPFPPLPAEFNGDQIRLQLAFSYNAPPR